MTTLLWPVSTNVSYIPSTASDKKPSPQLRGPGSSLRSTTKSGCSWQQALFFLVLSAPLSEYASMRFSTFCISLSEILNNSVFSYSQPTQLTAPLHVLKFQTTKQLEFAGYKMVLQDRKDFHLGEIIAGKQFFAMMGKKLTPRDFNYDSDINIFKETLLSSWFNRISKSKSYIPILDEIFRKLAKSEVKVRTDQVSCFVTEEVYLRLSARLMVYGVLAVSKHLDRILVKYREDGIYIKWMDVKWTDFVRRLNKERVQDGWDDVKVIKLQGSIGLIFVVHAVLLFLVVVVYLIEDYKRIIVVVCAIYKVAAQSCFYLWFNIKNYLLDVLI